MEMSLGIHRFHRRRKQCYEKHITLVNGFTYPQVCDLRHGQNCIHIPASMLLRPAFSSRTGPAGKF